MLKNEITRKMTSDSGKGAPDVESDSFGELQTTSGLFTLLSGDPDDSCDRLRLMFHKPLRGNVETRLDDECSAKIGKYHYTNVLPQLNAKNLI